MNLKEMEEAYKTGDWIALSRLKGSTKWTITAKATFCEHLDWAVIRKDHEDILNRYLAGCKIVWRVNSKPSTDLWHSRNFIDEYSEYYEYLAVPRSLEGCYCDANELHYKELRFNRYLDTTEISQVRHGVYSISKYAEEPFVSWGHSDNMDPKIEYNEQTNKWVYCPKETEDGTISTSSSSNSLTSAEGANLVASNNAHKEHVDKPINNFEEFGFTAKHKGEILKAVELNNNTKYPGYIVDPNDGSMFAITSQVR